MKTTALFLSLTLLLFNSTTSAQQIQSRVGANELGNVLNADVAQLLFSDVMDGKRKAYADEQLKTLLSEEQLERRVNYVDSTYIERPEPPYDLILTIDEVSVGREDIEEVRMLEEWSRAKNGSWTRRTIAAAPAMLGHNALFWVRWDELTPLFKTGQ